MFEIDFNRCKTHFEAVILFSLTNNLFTAGYKPFFINRFGTKPVGRFKKIVCFSTNCLLKFHFINRFETGFNLILKTRLDFAFS